MLQEDAMEMVDVGRTTLAVLSQESIASLTDGPSGPLAEAILEVNKEMVHDDDM